MSEAGERVRRQIRVLEDAAEAAEQFRADAKSENGRLTQYGRDVLAAAKKNGIQQAKMARLLGISAGAVSQHYNSV